MSAQLVGQKLLVHYTLDPGGQLLDVWVLTAQRVRAPALAQPRRPQAASWQFNPDAQPAMNPRTRARK